MKYYYEVIQDGVHDITRPISDPTRNNLSLRCVSLDVCHVSFHRLLAPQSVALVRHGPVTPSLRATINRHARYVACRISHGRRYCHASVVSYVRVGALHARLRFLLLPYQVNKKTRDASWGKFLWSSTLIELTPTSCWRVFRCSKQMRYPPYYHGKKIRNQGTSNVCS